MVLPGRNGRVLRGASGVVPGENFRQPGPPRARCVRFGFIRRGIVRRFRQIRIAALALRENQMFDVGRVSRVAPYNVLQGHAASCARTAITETFHPPILHSVLFNSGHKTRENIRIPAKMKRSSVCRAPSFKLDINIYRKGKEGIRTIFHGRRVYRPRGVEALLACGWKEFRQATPRTCTDVKA